MNKKVYFAGSIRGGRQDAELYRKIISVINETDKVLTEHVGDLSLSLVEGQGDKAIYEQDTAWLRESDIVIAECSQPSLGVGYELAYAEKIGKPVHIFYRVGINLSAMLSGDDYFELHSYNDEEELLAEGKPLIYNRPIQIILASGICFALGHILELMAVDVKVVTVVFMACAVIAGYEIAVLAYNSLIKQHTIGPAMLVCIACIASFIIGHPEEGAAVTFLYFIAEFLEDYTEFKAKRSIKSLVEIAPETARVKVGDGEKVMKVDDVNIGDIVIVKPGDKVPLDGNIISGSSSINQASITGESVPVSKEVGDDVFSGTVNEEGYFEMVVSKESKDSVISKIVTLVKRSQLNRSETESLVEKVAKYYTPIMMVAAVLVAALPPLLFEI